MLKTLTESPTLLNYVTKLLDNLLNNNVVLVRHRTSVESELVLSFFNRLPESVKAGTTYDLEMFYHFNKGVLGTRIKSLFNVENEEFQHTTKVICNYLNAIIGIMTNLRMFNNGFMCDCLSLKFRLCEETETYIGFDYSKEKDEFVIKIYDDGFNIEDCSVEDKREVYYAQAKLISSLVEDFLDNITTDAKREYNGHCGSEIKITRIKDNRKLNTPSAAWLSNFQIREDHETEKDDNDE